MSEAPERIWAKTGLYYAYVQDWSEGEWFSDIQDSAPLGDVEYIRKDVCDKMVRSAYDRGYNMGVDDEFLYKITEERTKND